MWTCAGNVAWSRLQRSPDSWAGADVFVAGSAVYSADDPDAMVAALRETAEAAASTG